MAQEIADSKLIDTWGSGGTKIEPDISKIIEGWQLGEQPPHEYMNWLQNTFGSKLNHILKNGIAEWNNETEYLAGASVQHSGNVWLCETTNTNSEPTDLNANWEKVAINKDLTVTVDTLADLRSISYPANTAWASGYHAKNDGAFGSHIFRLKGVKTTETDNGGTVIIATIGGTDYVYELQYDGAVNVRWFGAKGDEINNDTIAIQKAFDYCTNIDISDGEFLINQITISNNNTIVGGNGTLKISSSGTALIANGKTNVKIKNIKIIGSNTPASTDSQDGDKGIYFINCTNSCVKGVVISNTYAWGIIQGGSTNCDFIDCTVLDSNNQSCIAVTNGCSNADIINCASLSSHLYGLEIETNNTNIRVSNFTARSTVAGISIVGSNYIYIDNSSLIGNSNSNNVPPNHSLVNGMGVQIVNSSNINFNNCEIGDSKRTQVYILDSRLINFSNCIFTAHLSQDLRGCIYIDSSVSPYSNNINIKNNIFDCQSVEPFICNNTSLPTNVNVIGNEIKNPSSELIRSKNSTGIFKDNQIITSFASNPTITNFVFEHGTKQSSPLYDTAGATYTYKDMSHNNYVLCGVKITWTPNTVTGNPQWFLSVAGVTYLIGINGTGYVAGTLYEDNIVISKRFSSLTQVDTKIISTSGDYANKVKFEFFEIPIV